MAKTLKIGIIGCGAIAEHLHVPDYKLCPQAELVAFCDIIGSKAKALADRFAPGVQVYTDYKAMLKAGEVEAVSVCTPNYLHGPITMAAAKAGCHVFVEKPMATSLAEAKKMIDTAKKNNVLLMVDQSQRRFPAHVKAKEVLDSGIMGKVLHVTAMFGHAGPENWSPTGKWFFKKKEARFGAMADLGVHKADLIRHLTGKEVKQVTAIYDTLEKKRTDVEDNFASTLIFDDGTMGSLAASWTVKGCEANYLYLHCANGTLMVSVYPDKPLVASLVNPACKIEFDLPKPPSNDEGGWSIDVTGSFLRAALGMEAPFCPGEEGMKSLAVILACEEAAKTGRAVKVKV